MAAATENSTSPDPSGLAQAGRYAGAIQALERAAAVLGWSRWRGERTFTDDAAAVAALELAALVTGDRVRDAGSSLPRDTLVELAQTVVDLQEARQSLRDRLLVQRYDAIVGVQAGLGRLRGIGSASALLDRATQEVCRGCGFDRSILFRVLDDQMIPVSVHYADDPDGAADLLAQIREHPTALTHLLLETEMIRRRMPMLVQDVEHDPRVHPQIANAFGATSYVAAPIMPEGRVIGFLHADRRQQARSVDAFDRDTLWTFAEGFGYAFESVVLFERLRAQRAQVRGMLATTEELIDELLDAEIAVGRIDQEDSSRAARHAANYLSGVPSRLDQLLTPREIEVIRLLAAGETNAGVASRLVISEGTVKSHVKHILRKLRASNRAEAVSRYLRLTELDGSA
jgi:DNA-binding CsgD family transcriptional regulator